MGSSNLGITNSAVDLILLSQWKVNQSIKCRCCWKTTVLVTLGLHPKFSLSWSNLKKSSKLPVFNRSSLSSPGFASGFLPTPSWNAPLLPVNAIRKEMHYSPWSTNKYTPWNSHDNGKNNHLKMYVFPCIKWWFSIAMFIFRGVNIHTPTERTERKDHLPNLHSGSFQCLFFVPGCKSTHNVFCFFSKINLRTALKIESSFGAFNWNQNSSTSTSEGTAIKQSCWIKFCTSG